MSKVIDFHTFAVNYGDGQHFGFVLYLCNGKSMMSRKSFSSFDEANHHGRSFYDRRYHEINIEEFYHH